jgi:hypothetical protein
MTRLASKTEPWSVRISAFDLLVAIHPRLALGAGCEQTF